MARLFTPLRLRSVEFKNRIFVSPMCQYSSQDGLPNDWHLVHLGSRAAGGAALVLTEATGVSPEARISPADSGLWSERHAQAFKRITDFIRAQGAVAGVQLAHAGRKASTFPPWERGPKAAVPPEEGGWTTLAPSAIPFAEGYPMPQAMSEGDIRRVVNQFAASTRLARAAGFEAVELHFAHGYLVHQFLSPLSNRRDDAYGGPLEDRMRLALDIARAARAEWPKELPLLARISTTDWAEGGWDLPQAIQLCRALKDAGVDLIDCSSGGLTADAKIPMEKGYQVPFAEAIRKQAKIPTGAVGLITEPEQAERILAEEKADAIIMGRQFLRDPYWPLHAAKALGADIAWPRQYLRAKD